MIIAAFKNGETRCYTKSAHQFDKGQRLIVTGIALPETFEVHMSNERDSGMAYSCVGSAEGVMIPDALFISGEYIYAWLYETSVEHEENNVPGFSYYGDESLRQIVPEGKAVNIGETTYSITIPVIRKPAHLPAVNAYGSTGSGYGYIVDENETLVMVGP